MKEHYSLQDASIILEQFKKQIKDALDSCTKNGRTPCKKIAQLLKEVKAFRKFCAIQMKYWGGYYRKVSNSDWNKCFYNMNDMVTLIELFDVEGDCYCKGHNKRVKALKSLNESINLMDRFFKKISVNNEGDASEWPLSKNISKVIKKSKNAVVFIRTLIAKQEKSDEDLLYDLFGQEFKDKFFKEESRQISEGYQEATGTGFIISKDGYILTNNHVIEGGEKLLVEVFGDEKKDYEAKLIGTDPSSDIALLKIVRSNCDYLEFSDSDKVEEGQWTIAIGHPFRMKFTSTTGIVSAVHRTDLDIAQVEDYIQTDAAINPGNSGGPLLNMQGQVIGMNTAILTEGGGSIGLGFAVPSNLCREVLKELKKSGKIDRARLGVHLQDIDDELKIAFKLRSKKGAIISDVAPGSSGFAAGLLEGDIIVEFDGQEVQDAKHVQRLIVQRLVGQSSSLKLIRKGKSVQIDVRMITFFEPDHEKKLRKKRYINDKVGLGLEGLSASNKMLFGLDNALKGLVITYVQDGSKAQEYGLKVGSVIMKVGHTDVSSVDEIDSLLRKANKRKPVILHVLDGGKKTFISIRLPKVR